MRLSPCNLLELVLRKHAAILHTYPCAQNKLLLDFLALLSLHAESFARRAPTASDNCTIGRKFCSAVSNSAAWARKRTLRGTRTLHQLIHYTHAHTRASLYTYILHALRQSAHACAAYLYTYPLSLFHYLFKERETRAASRYPIADCRERILYIYVCIMLYVCKRGLITAHRCAHCLSSDDDGRRTTDDDTWPPSCYIYLYTSYL